MIGISARKIGYMITTWIDDAHRYRAVAEHAYPPFSLKELASKHVRLPDGSIKTIGAMSSEEFNAFFDALLVTIHPVSKHRRLLRARLFEDGINTAEWSMSARWYILDSLMATAIFKERGVALFVEDCEVE